MEPPGRGGIGVGRSGETGSGWRAMDEVMLIEAVPPALMDRLWEAGWRHFGVMFFRYSQQAAEGSGEESEGERALEVIQPLRIDLERWAPTKSQRRVLRRNADVEVAFRPAERSEEAEALFQRHKTRFRRLVPETLGNFLSANPAKVPCRCVECRVTVKGRLVALSFLDVGEAATSAVYGVFEPEEARRSLGIFTMLKEIEHSRERGCRWYYPGYATQGPSAYDYKKQFRALEWLDWESGWRGMEG